MSSEYFQTVFLLLKSYDAGPTGESTIALMRMRQLFPLLLPSQPPFLCSFPHLSLPLSLFPCLCIFSKPPHVFALTGCYTKTGPGVSFQASVLSDLIHADPSTLTLCSFNLGVHGLDARYFLDCFANSDNSEGN